MSRAITWERVGVDDLVKGDRVIAIKDTRYLPDALIAETFVKTVSFADRRAVVFSDKGTTSTLWVYDSAAAAWRFYRKVKRS